MKVKNLILIIGVIITLVSCSNSTETCNTTYFGGQIVNPKSKFVTLSKDEIIIDTIYLDSKNNFITQLDIESEGLYSFNHDLEYQYIYFEPKDSILIRLNTWDFDESLVFSGRGSEKNNFLITLYLQNEKDEHTFSSYYNLKNNKFEEKIAVSESLNNHLYDQLKESGIIISSKFDELAKVAISYPLNRRKEVYPLIHKNRFQLENYPVLSNTYYDFRKTTNLNNEDLISFAPYHNYVNSFLYAVAYQNKKKNSNFTVDKLNIIIENIHVESFKNNLLRQVIYNDFREAKTSCTMNKEALKIFNENCTNKLYLKKMNAIANDCEEITPDSNLDNFELATFTNDIIRINSVINNKKTVIYFWSPTIISPDLLVKRVQYLENKFPELLFVGVNMASPEKNNQQVNYRLNNQYYLTKMSSAKSFVSSQQPRTILVDNNGVIINSFTYLSSPFLERQLLDLEKK